MGRLHWTAIGLAALGLAVLGCAEPFEGSGFDGGTDAVFSDGTGQPCDPKADSDNDGIPNGEEGCLVNRDSDGDKIPDWQDFDSDDDGIYDDLEKGARDAKGRCAGKQAPNNSWPCDTDGDGVPDYLDVDSDGDGVLDQDEDTNGDGKLGCCVTLCNKPGDKQKQGCIINTDGCGPGQTCKAGKCTPPISFDCSNGETDPKKIDTFGDGKLDNERGTFICRDATEDNPKGRKAVQLRKSGKGDWHIALEKGAKYSELTISGAGAKEMAAAIDMDDTQSEVAGFVVSMPTSSSNVQDELTQIIGALTSSPPGGSGTISQTASGITVKSHDKYDSVQGTILELKLSSASNVSTVRNELIAGVMGKQMSQLGNLPSPYGSSHSDFVLRFVTVRRFAFKKDAKGNLVKDAKGNPIDDGDSSKWRLMVMGAVAGKNNYQDPKRATGINVEDLSNGTALATAGDKVDNECDVGEISGLPIADIFWVVDNSGSMYNNQQDVANNANAFFSRALSSGLDFRMAVMPACETEKLCKDRFLGPSEQTAFSSCIKQPGKGYCEKGLVSAKTITKKMLPRDTGNPKKIRTGAKLVVIEVTDELPQSLKSSIGYTLNTCKLSGSLKSKLDTAMQTYYQWFSGVIDPEAAGTVHTIAGVCSNSCGAEKAHGYMELSQYTGGQIGDVCQKDLGSTLQVIIDSIVAGASPIKLEYVPISSSLAVALNGAEVKRSRVNGFDYRSAKNVLVFISVKYKKGAEVIASYKRWSKQIVIK